MYVVTMRLAVTVVYLAILVVVLLPNVQCITDDNYKSEPYSEEAQRAKRGSGKKKRFLLGPDGQKSILADKFDPDKQYEHVDANGHCCCGLCNPGFYVNTFCTCSSMLNLEPQQITDCTYVDIGTEYMDKPNNSTVPYTCTESCKMNQTKTSDCTSNADITCECNEGWFNPNESDVSNIPKECRKIPGCKAGEEPIKQLADGVVMYTCEECQPGYFKLKGNSTKACEPHRVCQTIPGSPTSDVKCLTDDVLQLTTKAPLIHRTQLPSTLRRLADLTKTSSQQPEIDSGSSGPGDEERPQTTPGEKDHQPPTKTPESTGKHVFQFGFETGFYVVLILASLSFLMNLTLSVLMCKYMVFKTDKHPYTQSVFYVAVPAAGANFDDASGTHERAANILIDQPLNN